MENTYLKLEEKQEQGWNFNGVKNRLCLDQMEALGEVDFFIKGTRV